MFSCTQSFTENIIKGQGGIDSLRNIIDKIHTDDMNLMGTKNISITITNDAKDYITNVLNIPVDSFSMDDWIGISCAPDNSEIIIDVVPTGIESYDDDKANIDEKLYNPLTKKDEYLSMCSSNLLRIYARNPSFFKKEDDPIGLNKVDGSVRYLFKNDDELVLYQGMFFPQKEMQGKHLSDYLISREILTAKKKGISYITGHFVGQSDNAGYYYFPTRFGFDREDRDGGSLQELIATKGKEWWKKNGDQVHCALVL